MYYVKNNKQLYYVYKIKYVLYQYLIIPKYDYFDFFVNYGEIVVALSVYIRLFFC